MAARLQQGDSRCCLSFLNHPKTPILPHVACFVRTAGRSSGRSARAARLPRVFQSLPSEAMLCGQGYHRLADCDSFSSPRDFPRVQESEQLRGKVVRPDISQQPAGRLAPLRDQGRDTDLREKRQAGRCESTSYQARSLQPVPPPTSAKPCNPSFRCPAREWPRSVRPHPVASRRASPTSARMSLACLSEMSSVVKEHESSGRGHRRLQRPPPGRLSVGGY